MSSTRAKFRDRAQLGSNYDLFTVKELKDELKDRGYTGLSRVNRAELLKTLREDDSAAKGKAPVDEQCMLRAVKEGSLDELDRCLEDGLEVDEEVLTLAMTDGRDNLELHHWLIEHADVNDYARILEQQIWGLSPAVIKLYIDSIPDIEDTIYDTLLQTALFAGVLNPNYDLVKYILAKANPDSLSAVIKDILAADFSLQESFEYGPRRDERRDILVELGKI